MKKSRLIPLIILVVLIAAYFLLRSKEPIQKREDLVTLESGEIEKIEIWDSEARVDMILEDDVWKVTQPFLWRADTLMVNDFFRKVVSGYYSITPVSSSRGTLERYKLDDQQGTHVRLSAKDKQEHLIFGNIGNAWDYFRVAGDTVVYQTQNSIVQRFAPIIINWRDPMIVRYWEDEISEIRSKHRKNEFTLRLDRGKWFYKDAKHDFEVAPYNFALTKIVSILQNMNTYTFEIGDDPELMKAFENPFCTVWITDVQGNTKKLNIAETTNKRYYMMVDDEATILYQLEYDSVYRFTRDPEIFMRKSI